MSFWIVKKPDGQPLVNMDVHGASMLAFSTQKAAKDFAEPMKEFVPDFGTPAEVDAAGFKAALESVQKTGCQHYYLDFAGADAFNPNTLLRFRHSIADYLAKSK